MMKRTEESDMGQYTQQETNADTTASGEDEEAQEGIDFIAYEKCRTLCLYDTKAVETRNNNEWSYIYLPSKFGDTGIRGHITRLSYAI